MKITTSIVVSMLLLVGCAATPDYRGMNADAKCKGKGSFDVKIAYGDGKIIVTPKTKVKRGDEIIYQLNPEKKSDFGIDYENVVVEILGKNKDSEWLNKSGSYAAGKKLFVCVKDNQNYGPYDFKVHVPEVGDIDPRVEVIK